MLRRKHEMNQRLKEQLNDHEDQVLKLALMALTSIQRKLEKGMTDDEKIHTICTHVSGYLNSEGFRQYHHEIKSILRKTARIWTTYSGNPNCPVPAPIDFITRESDLLPEEKIYEMVFHGRLYDGNFWDKTTEYGRMRASLLEHHIEVLEDELNSRSETQVT
ncbi:hypothetical protein [Xanthomonas phage OP1]|uniref:Uncharacterized protein n=1 Tax=Xanthomonas phage OP1 TaxID=2994040 RepID=Q2NPE2_9CAUD|nr:hypothetical protein OP1_ORF49 [Xanthomonas phage OP1]BAE72754.1 hypothetical protein [Xanthomonas phage OP1]